MREKDYLGTVCRSSNAFLTFDRRDRLRHTERRKINPATQEKGKEEPDCYREQGG